MPSTPEQSKAYYKKNAAKIKARAAARYLEDPEKKKAYSKQRYAEQPELVRFEVRRSFLKRKYDVTTEQFEKMLKATKGICPCCRKRVQNKSRWCIDHCHRTKKIRGLICGRCNCALGFVKDDPNTLRRMFWYLERK